MTTDIEFKILKENSANHCANPWWVKNYFNIFLNKKYFKK